MTRPEAPGRKYGGVPAEARRRERRGRLVEAGLELFGTRGFITTSIDDVCTTANVNKRYFYESFASLDELFIAVYTTVNDRIETAVISAMFHSSGDIASSAVQGVNAFFAYLASDLHAARVFSFELAGRLADPAVLGAALAAVAPWRRLLRGLLDGADYHGLDPDALVTTVWALLTGVTVQWALGGFTEPVESVSQGVTAVLADIIATMPTDTADAPDTESEQL